MPATSAAHRRLLFSAAVYSINEASKAGLKQSIFLDVYGLNKSELIFSQLCAKILSCNQSNGRLTETFQSE